MSTNDERSLIPVPDRSLARPAGAAERILSAMVEESLVVAGEETVAQTARFRIGDYAWCEPDYRQILLWAGALQMEPVTVIEKLVAGKASWEERPSISAMATQFQDGRMLSLSWNLGELPLLQFRGVEGLAIERLRIYRPKVAGRRRAPIREISINLPSLRYFCCEDVGIKNLNLSGVRNLTALSCFLGSLRELDLSQTPNLTELHCTGCLFSHQPPLHLSRIPKLTKLSLEIVGTMEPDLANLPNLTELSCRFGSLRNLDLSRVPNLTKLVCDTTELTELALCHVPNLTELNCFQCSLRDLDLSHVPKLAVLSCGGNRLSKLDLSHVPNLVYLHVLQPWMANQLEELDIRPLLALEGLSYDETKTHLIKRPDQKF